jgi:hypothetical protein
VTLSRQTLFLSKLGYVDHRNRARGRGAFVRFVGFVSAAFASFAGFVSAA